MSSDTVRADAGKRRGKRRSRGRTVLVWAGRILVGLVVFVLLALGAVQAILQTHWGRERVRRLAVSSLVKAMPEARIELRSLDTVSLRGITLSGLTLAER